MIFFGFLMLFLGAAFLVANLCSAIAALLGLGLVLLQLFHDNKNFWLWLVAIVLLVGGAGSLGGSWGMYYVVKSASPGSMWPEVSWVAGYIAGGAIGVVLGTIEVVRCKGDELKQCFRSVVDFFRTAREDLAEIPF